MSNPADYIWHVNIARRFRGIPVRDSRISFAINHGNLVLWGLEKWGTVNLDSIPAISKETALYKGFHYIGGQITSDRLTVALHLEIIPVAPQWNGTIGTGYGYALVWSFTFQRENYLNTWEMLIDAHSGELLSFLDTNQYVVRKIVGAIYPFSNDECGTEGYAQEQVPIPFTNTGFAAPNDYTNFGGMYDYTSGTVTTTLYGRYARITDACGPINETSTTGNIDAGGTNGEHNCSFPAGHSSGDTFSARSVITEAMHMNRQVRSWITNMAWLDSFVNLHTNQNNYCNANGGSLIIFYRSGGGCRNTGEIAAILDHEWAHPLDTHDGQPSISQPGESIADITAALRSHNSCIGRGYWWSYNTGCPTYYCPTNPASYGRRCNGYQASTECCTNCTGIRDIDFANHADPDPETISNFTCQICTAASGTPCGKEVHCEGIPPAEAAWDFAARDLQAAPYNYDKQTAFVIADRTTWRGHNNVTSWYTCTCPSTSSGCGATNAYPNWVAVDDDDGNTSNGTPHMEALYNAFNRHQIACPTPSPVTSGCSGGPTGAPLLSATPANNSVALSWTSVPNTVNYYVLRTEGMGCDYGKAKIAEVSSTNYTDNQALNGRNYYYHVMPVGSNTVCTGPLSNCVSAIPVPCISCCEFSGAVLTGNPTGRDGDAYMDNCESATIRLTIFNIGSAIAQDCTINVTPVSNFYAVTTPMPVNVGNIPVDGNLTTDSNVTIGQGANKATCMQQGTFNITAQATGQTPPAQSSFGYLNEVDSTAGNMNWPFETSLDGWTIESGTWALSTARVNPGGSTRSAHSSSALTLVCDVMITPQFIATATTTLHAPNWYDTEPFGGSNRYDRANMWIVQSGVEYLLTPSSGKLYSAGNYYNYPAYCNEGYDKAGWCGVGTSQNWGDSVFNLSAYNGQLFQLRMKYMTDDLTSGEGVYLDDMYLTNVLFPICDGQSDTCGGLDDIPGKVLNTLAVSKSGTNLSLNWTAPGGTCEITGYGLYRGTLPWTAYNHASVSCSITAPPATIPQDTDSYYYLIVPNNASAEGSYGIASSGSQIPVATSPCRATQNINPC